MGSSHIVMGETGSVPLYNDLDRSHIQEVWDMKRYLCVFLLVLGCAGILVAGGKGEQKAEDPMANILVVASVDAVTTWDPSASFSTEAVYMPNIYETLIRANPPGSEEPFEPLLAESWEASADGLSWTFHLREGVLFHDGEPCNAQAVKAAIERTMELGLGAAFIFDPVESIQVVDDHTVRFHLSYAAPLDRIMASANGAWIFSPRAGEQGTEWFESGNAAGTGPYRLVQWKPEEEILFEKFDDYWGGWEGKHVEKVFVKRINDAVVLQNMLESGEADMVTLVPRESQDAVDARPDCKIEIGPSFMNYALHINTRKPPLDNVLVRQAICYALPYKDIITVSVADLGRQSVGPIPYGEFGHSEELFRYDQNFNKARALMKEAGYPAGLDRTLVFTYAAQNAAEQSFAPLVKESLAEIGIDVEIRPMMWTAQWELMKSGADKGQDLGALLWWPTFNDAYETLSSLWATEEKPFFNFSYHSNPEFDELISTAYATPDPEEAQKLYEQAQEILIDEAVSAFLFDVQTAIPMRENIQGVTINPSYPKVTFYYDIWKE